jgi:hypothetical protein
VLLVTMAASLSVRVRPISHRETRRKIAETTPLRRVCQQFVLKSQISLEGAYGG